VTLEPPRDPDHVSSFLNVRVADIHALYRQWRDRGAGFLTPPTERGHELRCYMRDPDGHLIEVGQATRIPAQVNVPGLPPRPERGTPVWRLRRTTTRRHTVPGRARNGSTMSMAAVMPPWSRAAR